MGFRIEFKRVGLAVVFLVMAAACFAQIGAPGYKLTLVDMGNGGKVRGLVFNKNASPGAYDHIDWHEVSFTFRVDPVNGAPQPTTYQWVPDPNMQGEPTEGALVFKTNLGNRESTGWAWTPNMKTVTCMITTDQIPTPFPVSTQVLVLGGRLQFDIMASSLITPGGAVSVQHVPPQDEGTNAWHLQLFANETSIELWEQAPQYVTVRWERFPGPGSTAITPTITYDWTLPSFVADPSHPEASQPGIISTGTLDLYGTAPGSASTVSCIMYGSFTDSEGQPHSGNAQDTTGQFVAPAWSNKVAVHKPVTIEEGTGTLGNNTQGVNNMHSAKWHVLMVVKDQDGLGMPGVVVQERFPNGPLQGMVVNSEANYWTTAPANNRKYTLWCDGFTDHGQTTGFLSSVAGSFNGLDNLSYIWPSGASQSTMHRYLAGTANTSLSAHGVLLSPQDWDMVFTAHGTLGQRGTMTHGGNSHAPPP